MKRAVMPAGPEAIGRKTYERLILNSFFDETGDKSRRKAVRRKTYERLMTEYRPEKEEKDEEESARRK